MRGAQCKTNPLASEKGIPSLKEFIFELFFDDMSTVETLFIKLVAHPFIDDADRIQILLEALSSLPLLSPAFHGRDPQTNKDRLVVLAVEPCLACTFMKVCHFEIEVVRAQTSIPNHVPFFVWILLYGEVSLDVRTIIS